MARNDKRRGFRSRRVKGPSGDVKYAAQFSAVLIGVLFIGIPSYLQKWLWMRQFGYLEVFWKLLSVQWGMFLLGFAFAFLFFSVQLQTGDP